MTLTKIFNIKKLTRLNFLVKNPRMSEKVYFYQKKDKKTFMFLCRYLILIFQDKEVKQISKLDLKLKEIV